MKFMRHDHWKNVLFLHWHLPDSLVPLLQSQHPDFEMDTTEDGRVWIGLILLTEQNVGPIVGRNVAEKLLITHHGVNVRSYVKGKRRKKDDDNETNSNISDRGITFFSLECDNWLASYGANFFGMPYVVSKIDRTFGIQSSSSCSSEETKDGIDQDETQQQNLLRLIQNGMLTTKEADDIMCDETRLGDDSATTFYIKAVRNKGKPKICPKIMNSIMNNEKEKVSNQHTTTIRIIDNDCNDRKIKNGMSSSSEDEDNDAHFQIECSWERTNTPPTTDSERHLAEFFVERYHVYTKKYGMALRGTVTHEPWQVETVTNVTLQIFNVDAYEPQPMRPILEYMADHLPDSALFSRGVGPVDFFMLHPV